MINKQGVVEFGEALLRTQDLDPTYVSLHGLVTSMEVGDDQLHRWLLAYWCFYHVGVACYLSEFEGKDFWDFMRTAARNSDPDLKPRVILGNPNGMNAGNENDRWPRAAERRHFRGQKCVDAVENLRAMSGGRPEFLVRGLTSCRTDRAVMTVVQSWPMFGPWIGFKAADMLERCAGVEITFDPNTGLLYEAPREGLIMLEARDNCPSGAHRSREELYQQLIFYFGGRLAPPAMDRPCGPQEVETILCKWKSYMGGHYHLGKDVHDHRGALAGWGETALRMLQHMPEEVTA